MHRVILFNTVEVVLLEIARCFVVWPFCYFFYGLIFFIWAYWMYTDVVKPIKCLISGQDHVVNIQEFNILSSVQHNLNSEINEYSMLFSTEARKSERDGLTDLYNKQHEKSILSVYQTAKSIFILNLDVNNLKLMNDIHGHGAGDGLIKSAARALESWKTMGDVYRMGGDEFMVVIMNKSELECKNFLEDWSARTGKLNRSTDDFVCDFAYGYAYAERPIDYSSLKKQADEAMYEHKKAVKSKRGDKPRSVL